MGGDDIYIRIIGENPSSAGWMFNVLMDNIDVDPDDLNMDLVDTGDDCEDTWYDAGYNIYRGGDPNARILRSIGHGCQPDMGVCGGPYSRMNIDRFNDVCDDCIYITDRNVFAVEFNFLPFENYFVMVFPGFGRVGPDVGETFRVQAGAVIYMSDNILDVGGTIQIDGQPDSMAVTFVFEDGGYIALDDTTDVENSYFNNCQVIGGDYGMYMTGVGDCYGNKVPIDSCGFFECG